MKNLFLAIMFVFMALCAQAQQVVQTIRGVVVDAVSGSPIEFATVMVEDLPGVGVVADSLGQFSLQRIPVGRHSVQCQFVGYEPAILKEILVSSARESFLDIRLQESTTTLADVTVRPRVNKEKPLNMMVTTGGRMFSVEEAARYAGGFDDPARLASAFAGVSASGTTNGISIHGNSPTLLLWRLEDVEIPNPNHFSDITVLGGGVFSSLSSLVIGNSDFLTCAFPAEYGNAVSGVFDMKMRNGNDQKYEHTFQVGVTGIDVASEGPMGNNGASYLANYRYSMTGLAQKLHMLDFEDQTIEYQDLNFKFNIPTRRAGTFSIWGTGLIDNYMMDADSSEWKSKEDESYTASTQYMGTLGLTHQFSFGRRGQLRSTVASSTSYTDCEYQVYDHEMRRHPHSDMSQNNTNLIFRSAYQCRFGRRWMAQAGVSYTEMFYDVEMRMSDYNFEPLKLIYDASGHTGVFMAFTSHSIQPVDNVTVNVGLNFNRLSLNGATVLEPRAGITVRPTERMSLSAAYGLHSRAEKTDVYFVESDGKRVNTDLGFTKSHHVMLTFAHKISNNVNLKVEPYYQYLFDIPVEDGTSFAIINRDEFFVSKALVNKGIGKNYGVDVTLERYLSNGWYGMVTASVFHSTYRGGDNHWYNTKYDRRYIINGLIGKEWMLGSSKQNVLSANIRCTYQGGDRTSPVDLAATLAHPDNEVQYDESRLYDLQYDPMFILHYTLSYRINKAKVSHEFAIKHINATGTENNYGHAYNYDGTISKRTAVLSMPNISYRIEF